MGKLITQCPSCSNTRLTFSKIECDTCSTTFEGKFDLHPLLKLSEDELQFILDFVICSGSLKHMAKRQSVSYPTLRNRLNDLIEHVDSISASSHQTKDDILKMLEAGDISAKEAAKLLRDM